MKRRVRKCSSARSGEGQADKRQRRASRTSALVTSSEEGEMRSTRARKRVTTRPSTTRRARRTVSCSNFSSASSRVPRPSRARAVFGRCVRLVASLAEAVRGVVDERKASSLMRIASG